MKFSTVRRRMSAFIIAGTLATTVLFGANQAQATIVGWTVDTYFNINNSVLSGSFQFNTADSSFLNIDLTLTGGAHFSSGPFHFDSVYYSTPDSVGFSNGSADLTDQPTTAFYTTFPDTFGTVGALVDIFLDQCVDSECNDPDGILNIDTIFNVSLSGSVIPSAVPVPAALPLFGTGLAIMGFVGWRRKQKTTTA